MPNRISAGRLQAEIDAWHRTHPGPIVVKAADRDLLQLLGSWSLLTAATR
jgi:hypothetical protein